MFGELISRFAEDNGIKIKDRQLEQFELFAGMLTEKNKVMNLTAIEDAREIEIKHMIDSLEGLNTLRELKGGDFSLLDIGCGAGFPGIPLKIMSPGCRFVLLDSMNKRISFVNDVIRQLGLDNTMAVASRAEDYDARESFDFCTSRAVARMNVLLEYCLPFVRTGGYCVLFKSGDFQEELDEAAAAIDVLGGSLTRILSFDLPENGGSRALIVIEKIRETPQK